MVWPASWIEAWDELRAVEDDHNKVAAGFHIDSDVGFGERKQETISVFAELGQRALTSSDEFFLPKRVPDYNLSQDGRVLTFPSARQTEHERNNLVTCRIRESTAKRSAVVILPHWNAVAGSYAVFSRYLRALGISSGELTLPYHGERNDRDRRIADRFLSANLGLTVRSVQQAVMDTVDVLNWFGSRGYDRLGVIGISLGSCVAGIVAAHYHRVTSTSLLLTAGDFAEVVWTGRATRHIRKEFHNNITLPQLQTAWAVIGTENYVSKLARPDHNIQVILASKDNVVLPHLSRRFVDQLQAAGATVSIQEYACGHYTIGMFPYGVSAFLRIVLGLRRAGFFDLVRAGV